MSEGNDKEIEFGGSNVRISFKNTDQIKTFLGKAINSSADKILPPRGELDSISLERVFEDFSDDDLERFALTTAFPNELVATTEGDHALFDEIEVRLESAYGESSGPWVDLKCFLNLSKEAKKNGWGYLGSKKAELLGSFALKGIKTEVDETETDKGGFIISGQKSDVKINFGPIYKNFEEYFEQNWGAERGDEKSLFTSFVIAIYEMPLPTDPNFDNALVDFQEIAPKIIDSVYEIFDLEPPQKELVVSV
ncbi:MAG: hypothetical protein US96_C0003G0020 [Candidatus Woesebacteria bacterium GW2011_GWB1_38_5b]|uniref:Uncharacterized protein n=1 Tax=Candidatus Woesebacteria bacterium GW2011_GWB1_38_5b TaxID=1618569 RepID=A0A0G0KAI2_9BACT|nr:MAG: hypothetical protein US96_C0003G0020 [Candidatus Woesebacteria bacterium GW2011_GWB1_38_5b]